jgi:hypothetical protein
MPPILHYRRLILPLLLLLLGVATLAGCIYIPWPHTSADPHQVDLSASIGNRDSGKALRVGQASKQAVIALLGPPVRESADGRVIAYLMARKGGVWIMPLCFYAKAGEFDLAVRLEFDAGGTLLHYQFMERENNGSQPTFLGGYHSMHRDIQVFLDNIESAESANTRLHFGDPPPRKVPPDPNRYETVPPR